ncbi:MAG: 2-aminoethylphosphonate--pyruvate transaminase [Cellvibrionales bacterium]|nr:2-aminoethylphosphonate--pyruvate transaminase [Cellvibrionales bacterium]
MYKPPYLLLTPGPLTTSPSVKETMLNDFCTWDDDYNQTIVQTIRQTLVALATKAQGYTSVLLQGSGTYCVEAVLQSFVGTEDKLLIINNGAYGERIAKMCDYMGINALSLTYSENQIPSLDDIEACFTNDKQITHLICVHCETTSGILNPIKDICTLAKAHNKITLIDAMSSFGGMPMDMDEWHIDVLISSANKCLQGVPGFGFVLCKTSLITSATHSRSLSLDLHAQWQAMHTTGKWRFTSPTHTVRAFLQALIELEEEGGISLRYERYKHNQALLSDGMQALGFKSLVSPSNQSAFITSFAYPTEDFDFKPFYHSLKQEGFIIYPGKLTDTACFRIGNIGEIYPHDIERLLASIKKVQAHDNP